MFVHPLFDYLLIGGGLSLLALPLLPPMHMALSGAGVVEMSAILLLANSCHFAASTVRLYTKEGAVAGSPLHSMVFPLAFLLLIGACVTWDDLLGRNFFYLYLTWSPYHYAAQAYGLAAMYGHRSGSRLGESDTRLLWIVAMSPFVYAFVQAQASGLMWFVPEGWFAQHETMSMLREGVRQLVGILVFALPVALFFKTRTDGRPGLPGISYLILLSNGVWWVAFQYVNAFGWATVAHSVQYLAIMLIFHVRENVDETRQLAVVARVAASFYAKCLALGYVLFHVLPYGYVALGYPLASSMLVVAAAINIHHFLVDRVIWRQRNDSNLKVVVR